MPSNLFVPHGGHRSLDTFMLSTLIYYGTFCVHPSGPPSHLCGHGTQARHGLC